MVNGFSALGFYPVNPINGKYWFGSPQFEKAILRLPNNTIFTIKAKDVSDKDIYIKSKKLNGQPLHRSFFTYDELEKGGTLAFEMTPRIPDHK